MLKVSLVNPPFASLAAPSFALTQLKELLRTRFDEWQLQVSVHYLNIDFGQYLGYEIYHFIANSVEALNCGIGEWIFRQIAFPHAADNTDQYFRRYGHHLRGPEGKSFWQQILDKRAGLEDLLDSMLQRHGLYGADIVGFTSMFAQNVPSFALARMLKARQANILTVIGGANCESPMGEEIASQVEAIDYVFSGPSLVSFPRFIQHVINNDLSQCSEIDGVLPNANLPPPEVAVSTSLPILGQDSPAKAQMQKAALGRDLDIDHKISLDYSHFLDKIRQAFPEQVSPMLFFETSRGCWWGQKAHCTFCGLNGSTMTYRAMKSELAIEQFEALFKYSDRVGELQCVDNIMPKSYVSEVLPFLNTPPNMKIFYEVKADLSQEDLQTLSRARVTSIQPGIEALATSTLKLMKKGTTALQNIEFLKNCLGYGIDPSWNLLVGFPGEEEDVYRRYEEFLPNLVHLPPPSGVFPVRFDRYSPYFVRAAEYQLTLRPLKFYELVYPFGADSLARMAYFFTDENVFAPYALAVGTWINRLRKPVSSWRDRWKVNGNKPPVLSFENETSTIIADTRSGKLIHHDVGNAGRAVLKCLAKRRTIGEVARQLDGQGVDIEKEVRNASERGLLFEENGRLLSLVMSSFRMDIKGNKVYEPSVESN